MTSEDLWQHLLAEYARMRDESMQPDWRDRALWVMHPRWRGPLWVLDTYGSWGAPLLVTGPIGQDMLMGIRVLCGTGYAKPRLTCDPLDCIPSHLTARSLTLAELMAR